MFGRQAMAGFVADGINVDTSSATEAALGRGLDLRRARTAKTASPWPRAPTASSSPADVEGRQEQSPRPSIFVLQLETPLATVKAAAELAANAGVR